MICSSCKQEKSPENYSWKYKKRKIRQAECKSCKRAYARKWYRRNKKTHKQSVYKRRRGTALEARKFVIQYLRKHACVDCGVDDIRVLEFDHIDKNNRRLITELVGQGYGVNRVKREIQKCVVRCANCHRIKTSIEQGWLKASY